MKLATRQARNVCILALVRLKRRFIGENSGRDLFVRKGTFDHYHQPHCGLPASVLPSSSTAATLRSALSAPCYVLPRTLTTTPEIKNSSLPEIKNSSIAAP